MACGCEGRRAELVNAVQAVSRGDVRDAAAAVAAVAKTLAADVRSGALRAAAVTRLAQIRR